MWGTIAPEMKIHIQTRIDETAQVVHLETNRFARDKKWKWRSLWYLTWKPGVEPPRQDCSIKAIESSIKHTVKWRKVAKRKKDPSEEEEGWCTDLWSRDCTTSWKNLPWEKSNLENRSKFFPMRITDPHSSWGRKIRREIHGKCHEQGDRLGVAPRGERRTPFLNWSVHYR